MGRAAPASELPVAEGAPQETWEEQWPLECTSLNTTAEEGITNACFSSLYVKVR